MQYYYLAGAALLLASLQLLQIAAKPEPVQLRRHEVCKSFLTDTGYDPGYCDRILSRLPATAGYMDYAHYIVRLARRHARRVDSLLAAASAGRGPKWLPADCRIGSTPVSVKLEKIDEDIAGLPATACGRPDEVLDRLDENLGSVTGLHFLCAEAIKSRKDMSALVPDMDKGVKLFYLTADIVEDALKKVPWNQYKSSCGDSGAGAGRVVN